MSNPIYEIRGPQPGDINFILATWLRGLYYGDTWFSEISKDIFMYNYKVILSQLLSSPKVKVNVACLTEDPAVILGYSVTSVDNKALAWIFVKSIWRKQGIGRALVPKELQYVTHLTSLGKSLLKEKLPRVTFNPFY